MAKKELDLSESILTKTGTRDVHNERTFLSWFFSPIHIVFFVLILLFTHPLICLANLFFGKRGFYAVLKLHNFLHILNMRIAGTRVEVKFEEPLPERGPIIYVANHQSMYDIPFLVWFLRTRMPHFIAKMELKKFIPFISFALRNGGHLSIDRDDRAASITAIREYAVKTEENGSAVCIFPEGTRAKDGIMKKFKTGGLTTLLENMPSATVIPVTVEGSWYLVQNKLWPIPFGGKVTLIVHKQISPQERAQTNVVEHCFSTIRATLERLRDKTPA